MSMFELYFRKDENDVLGEKHTTTDPVATVDLLTTTKQFKQGNYV